MGDDTDAPHEYGVQLAKDSMVSDIVEELAKINYIPHVVGKDWGWELIIGSSIICTFSADPENSPIYLIPKNQRISVYESAGNINVYLRYYSKWDNRDQRQ